MTEKKRIRKEKRRMQCGHGEMKDERCNPREVTNDRQHSRITVITEHDIILSTSIKWDFRRPNNYNLVAFVYV